MKSILSILAALVAVLQYELWFAPGGLLTAIKLHHTITAQKQVFEDLEERNQKLLADINDLKKNPEAVVAHARYDLGMVKRGEAFYQLEQLPNG